MKQWDSGFQITNMETEGIKKGSRKGNGFFRKKIKGNLFPVTL